MLRALAPCLLVLLVLIGISCKRRPEPAAPETVVEPAPTAVPQPTDVTTPADGPTAVEEVPEPKTRSQADEAAPGAPHAIEAAMREGPEQKVRERDLASELRQAVGSPKDCLRDYRPASATTIRIDINAVVRPTGMIIEPRASGRGLSANDRRCIEERIGAVTLEPLDGKASEPISTYVDIAYQPPAVEVYDVAPPPPPPDDVVQSLPKKKPIAPSGVPIEGPPPEPIEGPSGVPISGPDAVPIEGPEPVPIQSD